MVQFAIHFGCRKKIFDHTARNGSNYLNGHCFVGEVVFYEQKNFWSFGKYMLRSVTGIENYKKYWERIKPVISKLLLRKCS